MKSIYYIFLLVFCFSQNILAQSCIPDTLFITSQIQIDNFQADFPGCSMIEGSIFIRENPMTPITSLGGLNSLTAIENSIHIRSNSELTTLTGLENLSTIGGNFIIQDNLALTNLSGVENLNTVGGMLSIRFDPALNNLTGLEQLTSVGASLSIDFNSSLTDLSGLENLHLINGSLIVNENDNLTSIDALSNLDSIGNILTIGGNTSLTNLSGLQNIVAVEYLLIENNPSLVNLMALENLQVVRKDLSIYYNDIITDLTGLENITSVGANLFIIGNELLSSLTGLENLNTVGENFSIIINEELTDLTGLENLSSIGGNTIIRLNNNLESIFSLNTALDITKTLQIDQNPNLSICHSEMVCTFLDNGGQATIFDNALGCESVPAVQFYCNQYGKICHPVFYDLNQNGIYDTNEPFHGLANMTIDPGSYMSYSNEYNGGISYLSYGDYVIQYQTSGLPDWTLTTPNNSLNFYLSEDDPIDTVYFGIYPSVLNSHLNCSINLDNARCNSPANVDVFTLNTGTTTVNGTLWFEKDSLTTLSQFIDLPDTIVEPNSYGWFYDTLYPGNTIHREIQIQIPGPPEVMIGSSLHFKSFTYFEDSNGSHTSEYFEVSDIVNCAYDPNDKLVHPTYPQNYALVQEDLVYTIRFQNTGNAVAFDVIIRDTLDSNLDATTFQVLASSHSEILSTTMRDESKLTFEFKDIHLPDSTTNFDESQGFVQYQIKAKQAIDEGTIIENTASIYFDLNPPIQTNTTTNVMVYSFDVDQDGVDIFSDCDDWASSVYPGAIEIPNNGVDEDCDGADLIVSTHNSLPKPTLKIRPNPTTGSVRIQVVENQKVQLMVRDLLGNSISKSTFTSDYILNLEHLPDGVYILDIVIGNQYFVKRIIKAYE